MAFPDLFKLEKLKIFAFSDAKRKSAIDGSPFEAMFNPQTLSLTRTNTFAHGKATGGGTQSATFVRSAPSDLSVDLLLDGTGVDAMGLTNLFSKPKTVQEQVDGFMALAYRPLSDTHEPSYLKVQWGKLTFECRLIGATVKYTSFDRDGSALRAELNLTLTADGDRVKQQSLAALTSPDVSHARLVRGGDTLPLMTQQVYGSTAPTVGVARANRLNHIRGLAPGQTLIFPPLAR
jgi:nucleoid-associated protein YgaU